jgi:hypothetical protein
MCEIISCDQENIACTYTHTHTKLKSRYLKAFMNHKWPREMGRWVITVFGILHESEGPGPNILFV